MSELLVVSADLAPDIGLALFVRGTAVAVMALILGRILRRASAATRHGVWALAFLALGAAPFAATILPHWSVTSPISWASVPVAPFYHATEQSDLAANAMPRVSEQRRAVPALGAIAVFVWLLVVTMHLARLSVHARRAAALVRRGIPVRGSSIMAALVAIDRPHARVVLSSETRIPLVTGLLRPTIALPVTAESWSPGLLESVLMHELAHVERNDYAIHLIARVVAALYWPNPLIRLAVRQLDCEQERACDDHALRRCSSHEYAGHLVEVAQLFRGAERTVAASLAMVRGQTFVERIRAILAPGVDRRPLSRSRMTLVAVVLAAALIPVVTLRVTRAAAPDPYLVTALADSDPLVRQRAAWALGEFESRAAVGPLLLRTDDPDPLVRGAVAWALGEIKDRRAVARLTAMLEDDEDALVREMAALALGEIGARVGVAPLVDAARNNADIRPAVVWALGEIDHESAAAARRQLRFRSPESAPWLDNGERFVQRTAVSRPEPVRLQDAIAALTAADPAIRAHGAFAAGRIGAVGAVPPLLRALRDPAIEVRAMAVWALDEINPSAASR